jgi:hypothetical protein
LEARRWRVEDPDIVSLILYDDGMGIPFDFMTLISLSDDSLG